MAEIPGQIYAGVQEANAIKAKIKLDQQIAEMNRQMADFKADDAIQRGKEDEQNYRKQVKSLIGSQRAALAASNIELSSGSALDVQLDAAAIGEADALTIRQNARMEAFGYKMEGLGVTTMGNVQRNLNQAALAGTRGGIQMSILTGGIKAASMAGGAGPAKPVNTAPGFGGTGRSFSETQRTA